MPRYFPAEIFFVFDNNSLVKVLIDYGYFPQKKADSDTESSDIKRLFSSEDFNNLVISLYDICGESDEEKAAAGNLFKEIANGSLTPEKLHPPQQQPEGENAAPVEVKDFTFTWTGKETDMTLSFRYDKDNDIYQNVRITKSLKK